MKNLITENTGISISILGSVVGAVMWISFIAAKAESTALAVKDLAQQVNVLSTMQSDIAVIRNKVERIEHQLDRRGK